MIRKFFSALAFVMMGAGVYAQLPDPGFTIDNQTAIVIVGSSVKIRNGK